jgi:hypothetical protein
MTFGAIHALGPLMWMPVWELHRGFPGGVAVGSWGLAGHLAEGFGAQDRFRTGRRW